MQIWRSVDEVPADLGRTVVSIGNFDGVHRGHQHVFARLLETSRRLEARSVVVTFDPHPALVHRPESHPGLIMGLEDKLDALETTGVDAVLVLPYSLEFSELSPEEKNGISHRGKAARMLARHLGLEAEAAP